MNLGDTIKLMRAAGCTDTQILNAIEDMHEMRRQKDRERKREERARASAMSTDSADGLDAADNADTPLKKPPHTPQKTPLTPGDPKGSPAPTGRDINRAFDELWAAYPKRKGANPREPARQKFRAALKSGAEAREIIDGAKRYAAEQRELGKVGTEFVAQLVVWLNQKRWQDYAAETGSDPPPEMAGRITLRRGDPRWDAAVRRYRAETGKPISADIWAFPKEWIEEEQAA